MKTIKNIIYLFAAAVIVASCGEKQNATTKAENEKGNSTPDNSLTQAQQDSLTVLATTWTKKTGDYNMNTYVVDFETLVTHGNTIIYIKNKSTCAIAETVNIGTEYYWLKITVGAGGKTFAFYQPNQLEGTYTDDNIYLYPSTANPRTLLRITNNSRGGNNTTKWIGSDDTRGGYTSQSSGFEFSNLDMANRYLGFKKDDAANKFLIKWMGTQISSNAYNYSSKANCEAITKNTFNDPLSCPIYTCPN